MSRQEIMRQLEQDNADLRTEIGLLEKRIRELEIENRGLKERIAKTEDDFEALGAGGAGTLQALREQREKYRHWWEQEKDDNDRVAEVIRHYSFQGHKVSAETGFALSEALDQIEEEYRQGKALALVWWITQVSAQLEVTTRDKFDEYVQKAIEPYGKLRGPEHAIHEAMQDMFNAGIRAQRAAVSDYLSLNMNTSPMICFQIVWELTTFRQVSFATVSRLNMRDPLMAKIHARKPATLQANLNHAINYERDWKGKYTDASDLYCTRENISEGLLDWCLADMKIIRDLAETASTTDPRLNLLTEG